MCELVLEIEEVFGISLADEQAERIITVGDLYAAVLVATADKTRNPDVCLSARTFYELRRYWRLHINDANSPARIGPSTNVSDALPSSRRRETWTRMASDLNLRFPKLQRPLPVSLFGLIASALAAIIGFVSLEPLSSLGISILFGVLTFVFSLALFRSLTVSFATLPGKSFTTFHGLTEQLMAKNGAKLADRHDAFSSRDVWTILRLVLMDQLGVDRDKITPDAHLVRDLGYD